MSLLSDDRPLWPFICFMVAMLATLFAAPAILDDVKRIVRLDELPYVWLLIATLIASLGFLVAEEAYDILSWDQAERRRFAKQFALFVTIALLSIVGSYVIAVFAGWTYGLTSKLMLIPIALWMIWRLFHRSHKEVWN